MNLPAGFNPGVLTRKDVFLHIAETYGDHV